MIESSINKIGEYFDGNRPTGQTATLQAHAGGVVLLTENETVSCQPDELLVSPRIAGAKRFIQFPNGGQFQCEDSEELDQFKQEKTEAVVAWLESMVGFAVLGIALMLFILQWGYFTGIPKAAELIVENISIEAEVEMGEKTLAALDELKIMLPSNLAPDVKKKVLGKFNKLRRGLPHEKAYRLEFRRSPSMGANAIALPGGIIIVTDGLVNLAKNMNEVAAVMAHEIGHIEYRHSLKSMVQDSFIALLISSVTGDISALGIAGMASVITGNSYSQKLESDADNFAFSLLKSQDISPAHFANIMIKLYNTGVANKVKVSFLSTHPPTQERVNNAEQAAREWAGQ
ncbi:MAG: M48 family metallopeptidase [Gammaproteobacteria bacterium]|nr:M48 family metallopeptidase [Gammaproteobacteria bacterium]MDH5652246.1 M48 family metallopeptidase [Gammaproteobacteria bacterium]